MKARSALRPCIRVPYLALSILFVLSIAHVDAQQSGSSASPSHQAFRAGGQSIVLPSPGSDMVEIGDDYRVVLEPVVPNTNRLLAAFVLPADVQDVHKGTGLQLSKYAMVEILRRAEFLDVSAEIFKQLAQEMAKEFGGLLDTTIKSQQDEFNRKLKEINPDAATINLDKPVPLGVLFSKPNACAFGMIMQLSVKGTATKVIGSTGIMRVQNRLLFVYLYTDYKDQSSADWLRKASEEWADAILKANS